MTTGDGPNPADGNGFDDIDDLDEPGEDLMEQLRRADPVDVEALPSSRSAEAMRTLKAIVDPDGEAESETGTDETSPSPAADGHGVEEAPPEQ